MSVLVHPDLVAARQQVSRALGASDKLAVSRAMFDHRNILRDLAPDLHSQWYVCREKELAEAFKKQVQS